MLARWSFLRRRCGVGTEEYYLGGGTRPRSGNLDAPPLPGDTRRRETARRYEPHQPEDGDQRVELSQRLQSRGSPEDEARGSSSSLRAIERGSRTGLQRGADCARSAALPQL